MRFLSDGLDTVIELNDQNLVRQRYVHGPGIDQPLIWYDYPVNGYRRGLMTDERGSVISVTNIDGNPIAINVS